MRVDTGAPWAIVPDGGPADVDAAVAAARSAFEGEWSTLTGFARAALLRRLGDLIGQNAQRPARLEVNDSGKLYREMIGRLNGLGSWYHYYAGSAATLEGQADPDAQPNYLVDTRREPVGVVAAITPWNSPLSLMSWKLAPAPAAGCTVVVKPSEHAPVSTLGFAELIEQAGLPPGVVNVVTGLSRETGAALAAHPGVDEIAFTGSTATGRAVAHAAAENLNKVTLELGGKSPQIVFPDADLAAAANGIIAGVFAATGQTCMAGSRLIVHVDVHDELIRLVAERAATIRLGDPNDPATEMGPVANAPQYEKVLGYLDTARAEGATVAYGGAEVHRGGRGAQARRRHPVRPVRGGVDQGRAPGAPGRRQAPRRHGVDQRLSGGGAERAVRRLRVQRVGPGERRGGGARVHREQVVWVELTGGTRDPFTLG